MVLWDSHVKSLSGYAVTRAKPVDSGISIGVRCACTGWQSLGHLERHHNLLPYVLPCLTVKTKTAETLTTATARAPSPAKRLPLPGVKKGEKSTQ